MIPLRTHNTLIYLLKKIMSVLNVVSFAAMFSDSSFAKSFKYGATKFMLLSEMLWTIHIFS